MCRDDMFVRLPEGGQSPKQKVCLAIAMHLAFVLPSQCLNINFESVSRTTWKQKIGHGQRKKVCLKLLFQGTDVLSRQIPRICPYLKVSVSERQCVQCVNPKLQNENRERCIMKKREGCLMRKRERCIMRKREVTQLAGEERWPQQTLQQHTSQRLFQVALWLKQNHIYCQHWPRTFNLSKSTLERLSHKVQFKLKFKF